MRAKRVSPIGRCVCELSLCLPSQEMIAFHPETLMLPWGAEKQSAQDAASAQGSQGGGA